MTYPLFIVGSDNGITLRPVGRHKGYGDGTPYRFSRAEWAKEFLHYYNHKPIAAHFTYTNRARNGNT